MVLHDVVLTLHSSNIMFPPDAHTLGSTAQTDTQLVGFELTSQSSGVEASGSGSSGTKWN